MASSCQSLKPLMEGSEIDQCFPLQMVTLFRNPSLTHCSKICFYIPKIFFLPHLFNAPGIDFENDVILFIFHMDKS